MSNIYSFCVADTVLYHFPGRRLYFRDGEDEDQASAEDIMLHARVRSGDYFSTVATELDQVIEILSQGAQPGAVLPEMERIVDEMIKVGKAYKLEPRR